MKIFLSYSHTDSAKARYFAEAFRNIGVELIWDERFEASRALTASIEAALEADYMLVLVSKASKESAWVRHEWMSRLNANVKEPKLIPVRLDDTPLDSLLTPLLWVDSRSSIEGAVKEVSRLIGIVQSRQQDAFFELMYFLLLVDQFDSGVWGASLEETSHLFGHEHDPGSISVSTIASLAIRRYTGNDTLEAITKYRSYLCGHQGSDGGFGMYRRLGTAPYPQWRLVEHSRHTATGLLFFLHFDGLNHSRVKRARVALEHMRDTYGAWVESSFTGEPDAITAAYVVMTLEQLWRYSAGSSDRARLDDWISKGLTYLASVQNEEDGTWSYGPLSRSTHTDVYRYRYRYTGDVLMGASQSWIRLGAPLAPLEQAISTLSSLAQQYGGVPVGPDFSTPNLGVTSALLSTLQYVSRFAEAQKLEQSLMSLGSNAVVIDESAASGWAGALTLCDQEACCQSLRLQNLRLWADRARAGDWGVIDELPPHIYAHEEILRKIYKTKRRIEGSV